MKVLLDSLFLCGQVVSLAALAYGSWLVLRERLVDILFPELKKFRVAPLLAAWSLSPSRRMVRGMTGNPGCR